MYNEEIRQSYTMLLFCQTLSPSIFSHLSQFTQHKHEKNNKTNEYKLKMPIKAMNGSDLYAQQNFLH